jgi:formate dehydrogenase maturation protein FdhE
LTLARQAGAQWERRIRRAEQLAADHGPAASLLTFYARVLRQQRALYDALPRTGGLSGSLARDAEQVGGTALPLVRDVEAHGPPPLADEARALIAGGVSQITERLIAYSSEPSDRDFFAKAILQAYGECLANAAIVRVDRRGIPADNRCPVCSGAPQLSFLEPTTAIAGDGGGRSLLCAGSRAPPRRCVRDVPSLREDGRPHEAGFRGAARGRGGGRVAGSLGARTRLREDRAESRRPVGLAV